VVIFLVAEANSLIFYRSPFIESAPVATDAAPAEAAPAENAETAAPVSEAETKPAAETTAAANAGKKPHFNKRNISKEDRLKFKQNIKAKFDDLPESDDPVEIRKQAEFYFSDSNLPHDNFLFNKVGGKENRSVPLKLIHSFKRMKRFQPYSAVVEALKTSEVLELTDAEENNGEDAQIRRRVPIDMEIMNRENVRVFEDKAMPRTIYAKGFGIETPRTQLAIEKFFAAHGPVRSVRLRRTFPEKIFKGSVFVEFETEEAQQAFLALDPKPRWRGDAETKEEAVAAVAEIKEGEKAEEEIKEDQTMVEAKEDQTMVEAKEDETIVEAKEDQTMVEATEEKKEEEEVKETQAEGQELLIMSKKAYCDMKVQEIKEGKIRAGKSGHQNGKPNGNHKGGFKKHGGHGKGDRFGGNHNKRKRADGEKNDAGSDAKKTKTEGAAAVAAAPAVTTA